MREIQKELSKAWLGKAWMASHISLKQSSKSNIFKLCIMKLEFCLTFQLRHLVKSTRKHYFLKLYFVDYGVLRLFRGQTLQIGFRCSLKLEIK